MDFQTIMVYVYFAAACICLYWLFRIRSSKVSVEHPRYLNWLTQRKWQSVYAIAQIPAIIINLVGAPWISLISLTILLIVLGAIIPLDDFQHPLPPKQKETWKTIKTIADDLSE